MVRLAYKHIAEKYREIKAASIEVGFGSCSVLVLVSYEVDSMATARILCQLLRLDNVAYAMFPVSSSSQLTTRFNERTDDTRTIILINCGAVLNIPELFGMEQGDVNFMCYILDNHRPFHLANIHSVEAVICFDDEMSIRYDELHGVVPEPGGEDDDHMLYEDNDDLEEDEAGDEDDDDDDDESDDEGDAEDGDEDDGDEEAELEVF